MSAIMLSHCYFMLNGLCFSAKHGIMFEYTTVTD